MDINDILHKIEERGWALYEIREDEDTPDSVFRGNVSSLDYYKLYAVFPKISTPKSYHSLARIVRKTGKNPLIPYENDYKAVIFLRLTQDKVYINDLVDAYAMGIEEFYNSLELLSVSPTCSVH